VAEDYQPGDGLKEGTEILILLSFQHSVKKSETPYIIKDRMTLSVLILFITEIFYLLVEQNLHY